MHTVDDVYPINLPIATCVAPLALTLASIYAGKASTFGGVGSKSTTVGGVLPTTLAKDNSNNRAASPKTYVQVIRFETYLVSTNRKYVQ